MLRLYGKIESQWDGEPEILRISTDIKRDEAHRNTEAFLIQGIAERVPNGFQRYFTTQDGLPTNFSSHFDRPVCVLPAWMNYLDDGDIVRLSPSTGDISVLYRRQSRFNSLLLTEQCNSNCIMCSQPPKRIDDQYLVDAYLQAIPLMDPSTKELGLTGGEPTLLGERLFDMIVRCRDYLPNTALHMLSNGRMFNYLSFCQRLAEINHSDLVIGIPLYSDIARQHNFVVQAKAAFDQTIRGIMNLERSGLRVEIRIVLHRQTVKRLPHLARFIARNLPFVEHVALMGLEMMGYVRMNLNALWIDPVDYQAELGEAATILQRHQLNVSIYNHQLCTIPQELWPLARKSISDWKNEYLDICTVCAVREMCGGFFSSSHIQHSAYITPIKSDMKSCSLLN